MAKKTKTPNLAGPPLDAEKVQDLAKIAFANMDDFARFEADGSVHIFDYDKAARWVLRFLSPPARLVEAKTLERFGVRASKCQISFRP